MADSAGPRQPRPKTITLKSGAQHRHPLKNGSDLEVDGLFRNL